MTAMRAELPVAVFDSGVGGLTVLHELLVSLPTEDYLYLGDTARLPYGNRSAPELQAFSIEIAEHLAVAASRSGRLGLLATAATVSSGAYERTIRAADPHVLLESVACPDLVPVIEAGFPFDQQVVETVRGYCAPLRAAEVDTVILGCTHYPLVAPMLQRMLGRGVTFVTSGSGGVRSAERALTARGLLNPRSGEGSYRFQCTGDVAAFERLGTRFLQMPLGEVVHVDLQARTRVAA
jgi:glutamate racemase